MTSATQSQATPAIPSLSDTQKRRQFTPDFGHRAIWLSGLRVVAERHSEQAAKTVRSIQGFVIYGLCMAAKAHNGYTASHGNALVECAGDLCSKGTLKRSADTARALGLLTWESTGKGRTGGMRTYYLGPALLGEAGKQFLADGKAAAQRSSMANRKGDRDPESRYGPSNEDLELYGPCPEFVEEMQDLELWDAYITRNRPAEPEAVAAAEAEPACRRDPGPSLSPAEWRAGIVERVGQRVSPPATHEDSRGSSGDTHEDSRGSSGDTHQVLEAESNPPCSDLRGSPGDPVMETSMKRLPSSRPNSSNHLLSIDLATSSQDLASSKLGADEDELEERDDSSQQDETGMLGIPCHSGRLAPPRKTRVQELNMTKQRGTVYGVANPLNLTEGDTVEVKEQRGLVSRYDWDRDEYLIIAESDDSSLGWFKPSHLTLLS